VDLLAAWLLYPLALGAICLGLGLLVERLADWRMPGALVLPVGLAALLGLAHLITSEPETARLALPLIGLLAIAGLVVARKSLRARRPDPWIAIAALGVYAVFAAPIVLSGEPSFGGYLALADTSHQLSLANLYAHHGPDFTALADGSNRRSMLGYVGTHYPVAAQAALGVSAPLGVLDLAWLYQPFLTVMAVVLCLAIAALAGPQLACPRQTAVVAFVAAQSALVVGFALQGSIKEIAAVAMLFTAAAVTAAAIGERRPARSLLALAPVVAAALGVLGPAALPYLAVVVLAVLGFWGVRIARDRRRSELLWIVATAVLVAVLALPTLSSIRAAITVTSATLDAPSGGGDAGAVLGNLAGPLEIRQTLGIWLSGDFRYHVSQNHTLQAALSIAAAAAAALGLGWALRRRARGPLLALAIVGLPSLYLLDRGSPYADAKVLMIVSPALLMLAMLGAQSLWSGRWRPVSFAVTGFLALGVLGSSALAYHDVSPAPHDRYEELLSLNERLAGKGPVVLNEYDEFGKYFLRDVPSYNEPEFPHGYRPGFAFTDLKRKPSLKTPLDLDDFALAYLQSVPYVIVRRSPVTSRPPANFRRAWSGRYYDLWRRDARPRVLRHLPLGPDILHPAARVSRASAREWGRRALRLGGRLATVQRRRHLSVMPTEVSQRSLNWNGFSAYPGALVTSGPGRLPAPLRVARSGRYRIWVEGSFARRLTLSVDGRLVGHTRAGLENPGAYQLLGSVRLTRGTHRLKLEQGGGDLRPANAGYRSSLRHVGPIIVQPQFEAPLAVTYLRARDWRRLIGMNADWLEILVP